MIHFHFSVTAPCPLGSLLLLHPLLHPLPHPLSTFYFTPAQLLPRPHSQVRGLSCNTSDDTVPSLHVSKEVHTASRRVVHTLLSSITGGASHPLPPPHVNCPLQTFACHVFQVSPYSCEAWSSGPQSVDQSVYTSSSSSSRSPLSSVNYSSTD